MTQSRATNLAAHPRRARALELLLEGRSDRETAAELGCEASTVWRWRSDPAFARELHDAQRGRVTVLNERMMALVPRAIETIAEMMNDPAQPGMLRLRAAESLLERASWSTGAKERRIQEELTMEVESLHACLVDRVPDEVLAQVVAALAKPWDERKAATNERPRCVVVVPGAQEEP